MAQHPELIPEGSWTRRRRRRPEAALSPAAKTSAAAPDAATCPECSGINLKRQRRTILDRFFFRNHILLCTQCGHREWGQDVVAARKVALSLVGAAWLFLTVYAGIAFTPPRRGPSRPARLKSVVAPPVSNRAHLAPEQNRALLKRMASGQALIPGSATTQAPSKP